MQFYNVLATLSVIALAVQAFTPAHPCQAYPTKVSKLATCSTASAFCTNYLKGPGSFTRTSTSTTTALGIIATTTEYSNTVTVTSTSTYSTATTTTLSTYAVTCTATNNKRAERRAAPAISQAKASCGIIPNAIPSQVSGACNCYLASSTTAVTTMTAAPITSTLKTDTTTTSTITSTTFTSTSTQTACSAIRTFYLQPQGSTQYYSATSSGFNDYLFLVGDIGSASLLTLDPASHVLSLASRSQIADVDPDVGQSGGETLFFDTPDDIRAAGYVAATCDVTDGMLTCNARGLTVFLNDGSNILNLATQQDAGANAILLNIIPPS